MLLADLAFRTAGFRREIHRRRPDASARSGVRTLNVARGRGAGAQGPPTAGFAREPRYCWGRRALARNRQRCYARQGAVRIVFFEGKSSLAARSWSQRQSHGVYGLATMGLPWFLFVVLATCDRIIAANPAGKCQRGFGFFLRTIPRIIRPKSRKHTSTNRER